MTKTSVIDAIPLYYAPYWTLCIKLSCHIRNMLNVSIYYICIHIHSRVSLPTRQNLYINLLSLAPSAPTLLRYSLLYVSLYVVIEGWYLCRTRFSPCDVCASTITPGLRCPVNIKQTCTYIQMSMHRRKHAYVNTHAGTRTHT